MTRRLVAVIAPAAPRPGSFPWSRLRAAMVEDVYERVAALELVEPVLVVHDGDDKAAADGVRVVVWPGTLVIASRPEATSAEVLSELASLGADEAVLVAGDAPDLPALLIGKLHRALGTADVAVLPARDGGLVAIAARCPLPEWFVGCGAGLDVDDALARLQQSAPRRSSISVGPGWHRVRHRRDLQLLDPGLEGWETTQEALRDPPRAALRDTARGAPGG